MIVFPSSKKGVSPLIATVLLIAFAVALGSVVMNWGLSLNLGKSEDTCRNVEIKTRSVDSIEACFGGFGQNGYINFIIDNTGSTDISGLAIWVVGDKGTKLFDLDSILIKKGSLYDKKDKEVSYDFVQFGNIKQVQFIPKVMVGQTTEICPKNAVKAEKIGVCS
jgi:flagellin-like protein